MSNSSLAKYIYKCGRQFSRNNTLITKVAIHTAGQGGDCEMLASFVDSSNTSYHYGIADDGTVAMFVDEMYRACDTGIVSVDRSSVSIVVAGSGSGVSSDAYDKLIKLVTDICRRNFIFELKYTGSPSTSNVVLHSWYGNGGCPGGYLTSRMYSIVSQVNSALKVVSLATSDSQALKSQSSVIVDAINPYVATIAPSARNINYRNLRNMGCVGAMFFAGSLYNPDHTVKDRFVNPQLKYQMQEVKRELPFALYATFRAKDAKEARKECEEFYYPVSKYPPKLGVWANLELPGSNVAINNSIIDMYYKLFYKWGLHDKCGLYCTRNQLNRITWTNYQSKMSLWLIDSVVSTSNLHQLLTPNFFKL